jgi:hypothetical protein
LQILGVAQTLAKGRGCGFVPAGDALSPATVKPVRSEHTVAYVPQSVPAHPLPRMTSLISCNRQFLGFATNEIIDEEREHFLRRVTALLGQITRLFIN